MAVLLLVDEVLRFNELPPSLDQRFFDLLGGGDVRKTVADLDHPFNLLVLRVVGVVLVGHAPLVAAKVAPRFDDAQEFLEAVHLVRGVRGGLDLVDAVKVVVGEGDLHEVSLHKVDPPHQILTGRVELRPHDLVRIVVQTGDVGLREPGDFAGRTTHATSDVQDFVALLHLHLQRQVVLVAGNARVEALELVPRRKVEGCSPAVLIKVGNKVVVEVGKVSVVLLAVVQHLVPVVHAQVLPDDLLHIFGIDPCHNNRLLQEFRQNKRRNRNGHNAENDKDSHFHWISTSPSLEASLRQTSNTVTLST
mmetsp:Transcript_34727/g.97924  ORF Transcript_34727/g.97924 Transcript_34727/m.97924 type:complete len:306 (-) Transcript_34727:55-972(-)